MDRDDADEDQSKSDYDARRLINDLFGQHDHAAGAWMVGDARLAAIPMRSLQSPVVWVTSPTVLRHLFQDLCRAGGDVGAAG